MNISITGNLGSGKSSICRILKDRGYDVISAGSIFRELAVEQGMSVEAFNQKVNEDIKRGDHSVDDLIDQRTARINKERDNVVFDSRLAWNFAPDSFKVFVMVDLEEAARRVYHDSQRSDSETYDSAQSCREGLMHRQQLEKQRFKELYQIDYYRMSNYNLVIESTNASPEDVAEEIIKSFLDYQEEACSIQVEMNPSSIFPTCPYGEWPADDRQTPTDHWDGITVNMAGGIWFASAGHERLLEALRKKETLVKVRVDKHYAPVLLTEEDYRIFEEQGQFQYRMYPVQNSLERECLLTF